MPTGASQKPFETKVPTVDAGAVPAAPLDPGSPGLERDYYGFTAWSAHRPDLWQALVDDARTRILLVEDDPADALLVQRTLGAPSTAGFGFRLYRCQDLASALERLVPGEMPPRQQSLPD